MTDSWNIEIPPTPINQFEERIRQLQLPPPFTTTAHKQLAAAKEAAIKLARTLPGPLLTAKLSGRPHGLSEAPNQTNSIQVRVEQKNRTQQNPPPPCPFPHSPRPVLQ
jgi:hypothetical protein